MNEFEHTLTNILAKHRTSVSDLAERAGYSPLFFSTVVSGKSRQIPVDLFVRVADVLNLSAEEKDALVCSLAFGVERWS